jgi:prepilin-type N-terminal cleavage/methylation domain-containing protein
MRNRYQAGFSLVEIAIVLVVIGLLLGALLKGQELINSARARTFADLATDTQAAYYGFIDRYNRVPGDWNATAAGEAIGDLTIANGGDDSGSIENPCPSCGTAWQEPNAMWEQMSKSGFIQGAYDGTDVVPNVNNNLTPVNPFSANIVLGRTNNYLGAGASDRLNLSLGRGIPVDIAQELDIKLDDGVPDAGVVRLGADGSAGVFTPITDSNANCHNDPGTGEVYNIASDEQDCSIVYLF